MSSTDFHIICYIHPVQAGIHSNLNLMTASGDVYSFSLEEIRNEPNFEPGLIMFLEAKKQYRANLCHITSCWHEGEIHAYNSRRIH